MRSFDKTMDLDQRKILLVDDDPIMLELVFWTLHNLGFRQLEKAGSGSEALEKMSGATAFDVIISDFNMPGMNGVDLCRFAAEKGLPGDIIFLSGLEGEALKSVESELNAAQAPYLGILEKPLDAGKLSALLDKAFTKPDSAT